ncbi:hypothetical protein GUJ93_ZPchr0008g11382 [Zizania palustris]|uniref:Pentatricopeptide repeat-containing protein n=1 Tax=Zizania palustris TaxID=103762 RepID=A0A8J5RDZ6_ZIZPA|nr:hypothetical protein GUJ93_ZPchr0008g11382 [Zizania palustris]
MASAAVLSASGHRLLSTASTAGSTDLPVPISHLRRLAQAGRLADIDVALAPLLPSQYVVVLSALSAAGPPRPRLRAPQDHTVPTVAHLNALLAPLLRRRRLARLVPYILSAHPSVPRDTITNSIHAKALCLRSGAGSAMHLLQLETPPSIQVFTTIIDSYYKQCKPHRAEEVWRAMVDDHGIVPDVAAYNVRITYKATNGTVEEVKELIRAMREDAGLVPDIVSYNALMRAMARHRRVDNVLEVYRSLQQEDGDEKGDQVSTSAATAGGKLAPDCTTYTCVVAALCKAGRWSEADDMFYEAVKRRKVPDLGTVLSLVRGLKEVGNGRAARLVVVGLRERFPTASTGRGRSSRRRPG